MLIELRKLLEDAERGRYLAPISREMIAQIIGFLETDDPEVRKGCQQQLAQKMTQIPCYGLALSSITRSSSLPGTGYVDLIKFEASHFGAFMIENGRLGEFAAHVPDMLEAFADILMAGPQRSLKEYVKSLADDLGKKIQAYAASGQVNEGKLAILQSLLEGLSALQYGDLAVLISVLESNLAIYPDAKQGLEFFKELRKNSHCLYTKTQNLAWKALFQLICAHMMAHNHYVQENGITHSRTGNMLCDCLADALALFNGYTNGMNYDARSLSNIITRAIDTLQEKKKISSVTTQIEQISKRIERVKEALGEDIIESKRSELEGQIKELKDNHEKLLAELQELEKLVQSREDKIARLEGLRRKVMVSFPEDSDSKHGSSAASSSSSSSSSSSAGSAVASMVSGLGFHSSVDLSASELTEDAKEEKKRCDMK